LDVPTSSDYTWSMSGPSSKPKRKPPQPRTFVPHPDDQAEVRAGLEEAERGEFLSEEESAEYLRSLIGEPSDSK
jgi:hypothetical protein